MKMCEFLWNGKQHKVKSNVVIQSIADGGYNMCDIETMFKIQKLKIIKKLYDQHKYSWKPTLKHIYSNIDIKLLLRSDFKLEDIPKSSEFYSSVFKTWKEIKHEDSSTLGGIGNQIIWYNKHILVDGKTLAYPNLIASGIVQIHNILNNGNIYTYETLPDNIKRITNFLQWTSLCQSIPKAWRNVIQGKEPLLEWKMENTGKVKLGAKIKSFWDADFKSLYAELKKKKYDISKAHRDTTQMYNFNLDNWKQIYAMPHTLKVDNRIKELQYKILHRFVATNKLLHKIGKRDSPRCNHCFLYTETIQHMFYECNTIRNFWFKVEEYLQDSLNIRVVLLEKDILYCHSDQEDKKLYSLINKTILLGKHFIYKSKLKEKEITPLEFIAALRTKHGIHM